MRWFSGLRRGDPSKMQSGPQSEAPAPDRLILFLLFDALPTPDLTAIRQDIAGIEPLSTPVDGSAAPGATLTISFGNHSFALTGIDALVPADSSQNAIDTSNWSADDKGPLRRHRAHMICAYAGIEADPTEQFIAALKVAAAFLRYGLIGVVDTAAWNCLPPRAITASLVADFLNGARQTIPVAIWTGFVKFSRPDGLIWFCSKGFHRWGAPDFALLGAEGEGEAAVDIFSALLGYVRSTGTRLSPGDTADLGGVPLRFSPVREYAEYLDGPGGTLVIERVASPR
ncbi:hypothetical protein [Inquilinus sp. CA228]|uniref:hypothetical protein n=1 Tax=Inquilinus sp. CA228 TaxID=3455609 RepID=UPI003F8D73FA